MSTAPSPKPRNRVCPYCGLVTQSQTRCEHCRGLFDPLSQQATQNAMGPWYIRDETNPFRPGCSLGTLVAMIAKSKLTSEMVIRGPSTRQFWTLARWTPGVAHRLGICHSCQAQVGAEDTVCPACGASFVIADDRQVLGLGEVRFLPGSGAPVQPEPTQPSYTPPSLPSSPPSPPSPTNPPAPSVAPMSSASPAPATGGQRSDVGVPAHFERELHKARWFQMFWFVGFWCVVIVLAGVLIVPRLDLETGPLSGWFRSHAKEPGVVGRPDLAPGEAVPIHAGQTEGAAVGVPSQSNAGKGAASPGVPSQSSDNPTGPSPSPSSSSGPDALDQPPAPAPALPAPPADTGKSGPGAVDTSPGSSDATGPSQAAQPGQPNHALEALDSKVREALNQLRRLR